MNYLPIDSLAFLSSSMETHFEKLDGYLQEFDQMQESADEMEMAMVHLKDEFCHLLSGYTTQPTDSAIDESLYYTDSSCSSTPVHFRFSTSSNISELDEAEMDDPRIHYLRCIAERMIVTGFAQDCVDPYSRIRRQAMDARLVELEIEARNTSHVQILEQEMQARKIRRWIKAARELIETIFVNEKLIIHHIFNGLANDEDVEEICFSLTVKSSALQLLNFAERISTVPAQSAPERLFPVLDLYEVLSELLPSIKAMFGGMLLGSIHEQAERLQFKLADVAKRILSEFEKSLLNGTGGKVKQTGDVLPLAKYVMDFLKTMAVYRQPLTRMVDCLNELIVSKPSGNPSTPEMDLTEFEEQTPLALHLSWITVILQFKLEEKSKQCKDVSLSHLFMMNNVYFIVQEITGSTELREMMGDDYVKMLTGKFRLAATIYLRSTWAKVLNCCWDQGLHVSLSQSTSLRLSKSALRERLKTFNAMFTEVHRTQAMWLVPDTQLREELWIAISVKLIPAYRTMIRRFSNIIERGYVKYTLADLENAVLDLFEGRPVSQSSRRSVDANSI